MKITPPNTIQSARRRVVIIMRITAVFLFVAGITLYFQMLAIRELNHNTTTIETELNARHARYTRHPIAPQITRAEMRNRDLQQTWEQLRQQVDTFHGTLPHRLQLAAADDARIDFKVALFEARTALRTMAQHHHVTLADDPGIAEAIAAEDSTKDRLWSLASVVRLVEILIGADITAIDAITPHPPFVYTEIPDENEYVMAFPVHFELRCRYAQLKVLLETLSNNNSFYAINRCDIWRPSLAAETLRVQITCHALRFYAGAPPPDAPHAHTGSAPARPTRQQRGTL